MEVFRYKALDAQGNKVSGEVVAPTMAEAEKRISAKDITVIAILPAGARRGGAAEGASISGPTASRAKGRISDAEAARTLENLAVMIKTGVPFVEALEAVATSTKNPRVIEALQSIKEDVVGGQSLSGAMRNTGGAFPPLVADMVRVAEEGGRLDVALKSAASYLSRSAELRKRVANAMMYPCVMMAVSILTVMTLVLFVIPRFAGIFSKSGVEIPATTKAMLALSTTAQKNPMILVTGLLVLVGAIIVVLRTESIRTQVARWLFRAPVLGPLLRQLSISRAVQSIATLLSSNVPLLSALEHGAKVSGYRPVSDALLRARHDVEHGASLSESLRVSSVFPAMLLQLVTVGERTGQLASLLQSGSESLETEVDARLKALVTIVEPLMIVVMGVIVGGITLSIITPIYNVVQNIK